MATVNFRLRKVNQNKHPILVYLSLGRNKMIQVKTDFTINPKDWSNSTKRPKQNNEANKKLFNDLKKLDSYIFDELNMSNSNGEIINRWWLEQKTQDCFNRPVKNKTESDLLTYQTQHIIDNANTRKIKGSNKIGLSQNRIKGYITFLNLIKRYEIHLKKEIRLTEINSVFVDRFTNWLINTEEYSVNYSGKQIDNLKTVCMDSLKREIKTHPFVSNIQGFKETKEDKHIITLTLEELDSIRNHRYKRTLNKYS